jgi:CelD/BcsL family acetyltransferase involved in cellulose biosynthesis
VDGNNAAPLRGDLRPVRALDDHVVGRWRRLAADALEPNPFFAPEMAVAAAQLFPDGEHDRLLTVWQGERLVLALPLRHRRRHRRVPVPAFVSWGHRHAYLGTPLVAPGDTAGAIAVALDTLGEHGAEWLVLEEATADGPVRAALDAVCAARRLRPRSILTFRRPILCRRPEATYLEGRLSGRHRKRLRRQRRQLEAALGGRAVTVDRAADGATAAIDTFVELEAGGWKGRSGTALASTPREAAFFRAAMERFAQAGALQVLTLEVGGVPVAALCAVVAGDAVFHLKIAHDERWARHSPGMLLEMDAVEAFHSDQRLRMIDSCTSSEPSPSRRLYPDRRTVETLLVPLRRRRGVAAVRALALGHQLRRVTA